ncbi:MAG: hypothetical protein WA997_16590, partial [Anaerolineales bacterium]
MTITLASELPYIAVDNLTIEASEAGVILDGSALVSNSSGLVIDGAQGATLRGLQIQGFNWGVLLVRGATYNTVGGDRAVGAGPLGQANLISGNTHGVQIQDSGTAHNSIIGNVIGTDISGINAVPNYHGIVIAFGAFQNVIGGVHSPGTCDGPCNLVSANQVGVRIQNVGTEGNQVLGNFIGTDLSGGTANGNESGIIIGLGASQNVIGGARNPGVCDGPCNLISGNVNFGVIFEDDGTTGNQVLGNFVGTNASGDTALPNNHGVGIGEDASDTQVGKTGAGEGNLISGNANIGVWIDSAGTTGIQVLGNIIGADISGMTAVPNYHGILISTGSTANQIGDAGTGAGNLISGNEYAGIWMEHLATPGNTIAGNKIGTNLTGTGAVPNYYGIIHFAASNNLIGGTEPGAGNLISGNALEGVHIEHSSLNSLLGNTIGTDVTGEVAIPNVIRGIFIGGSTSNNTIGGSTPGAGNLISGSGEAGIFIQNYESVGNHILGNRIGTNRAGSSSLPNGTGVLVIGSQETIIGGADT